MGPITRSTIRTSLVLGLRLFIQASTLLLVARLLGPEDFGIFAGVAALAVLMGTFSTFGMHLVLLAEVSKNYVKCSQILSYAVPTTLIVGSLLFFLYIGICLLLFHNLNPSLFVIISIGLTEILLLPLFGLSTIEELALGKTAHSQLLVIFPLGLRTFAVALVLFLSFSEPIIVFAWLYLMSAFVALYCRKLYKPNAWLKPRQWRLANKQELKNSAGYAVLALTAAGPSELDKMLAVKLLPLGMSGVYVAAARVMGAIALPIMALLLAALPRLFRIHDNLEIESSRLNHWIIISVLVYSLLISILLWWIAPWIELLFGFRYSGMTELLRYFCFIIPLLLFRISLVNILMSMGRPWFRVGVETLGMFVLVFFMIAFYKKMDILGIILALVLSEITMIFGNFIAMYSKYKNN